MANKKENIKPLSLFDQKTLDSMTVRNTSDNSLPNAKNSDEKNESADMIMSLLGGIIQKKRAVIKLQGQGAEAEIKSLNNELDPTEIDKKYTAIRHIANYNPSYSPADRKEAEEELESFDKDVLEKRLKKEALEKNYLLLISQYKQAQEVFVNIQKLRLDIQNKK